MSWQAWNESTPSNSTLEIRCTSTMLAVTGPGVVSGSYGGYYSTLRTVKSALGLEVTANACGNDYTGPDGPTHQAVDLPIF